MVLEGEMKSDVESNSANDAVMETNNSDSENITFSASTSRPSSTVRPPIRTDDSVATDETVGPSSDGINNSSTHIRSSYFHTFITLCVFYFYF